MPHVSIADDALRGLKQLCKRHTTLTYSLKHNSELDEAITRVTDISPTEQDTASPYFFFFLPRTVWSDYSKQVRVHVIRIRSQIKRGLFWDIFSTASSHSG